MSREIKPGAVLILLLFMLNVSTALMAQNSALTLHPGLTVDFSVYDAINSSGAFQGDYEFIESVTSVTGAGYQYSFLITISANYVGSHTVFAADRKSGTTLRAFWPPGSFAANGYVSYLTLSDKTFADLKAGKETPLHYDAGEDLRTLTKVGVEDLKTLINEQPAVLHTIKAKSASGGTFWILDNAALPMMVKAETKEWRWMATSIRDSGSAAAEVVSTLKHAGEATTHDVLFTLGSANLDNEAKPVLDSVVQYLKANPKVRIEIQGHTDNIGGADYNLALSQKRADAVKAYVTAGGINAGRLVAKGYGLTVPVGDNTAPEGRARNRRVVFKAL